MPSLSHLSWILAGALIGFFASFIFGDVLPLPVDVYYLIYFSIVIGFFVFYIRKTDLNVRKWFTRRLGWGLLLGVIVGALMVENVLSRPETIKLTGATLLWAIFWRGLVYGAIDGLLLFAFP